MTPQEAAERALSAVGRGTVYKLGAGGMDPEKPLGHVSDCSGFVAWAMGVSRKTDHPWYRHFNGGWLETSAIVRDARTPNAGLFTLVEWPEAQVGDLLVWGDHNGHQGHVGMVTATVPLQEGIFDQVDRLHVTHCSLGNFRTAEDAVQSTSARMFAQNLAIVARYIGWSE